ncbi:hypothetical protein G4Z05_14125 [Bacillus thermocopriae]|uniref:Uncharacterized protein n=1 Tax=Neobacillus thermocopriae TaxID=1215031 RepID=A0A6B3TUH8_9BACI|nr:hypothetical protein [Neobacillus thermocopriae]NEX79996.1 hypothetical protein [Neobacillus thermocopriae]
MVKALAILFGLSILLLIISLVRTKKTAEKTQEAIDMFHINLMKEINDVKESLNNIELDMEIISKEAGVQLSAEEKKLRREVLDLYKRQYSLENIAEQKQMSVQEINQIITTYVTPQDERGKAAHEG